MIGLSSNIKNSPQAATYKNSTTPFPQTPTPSLGACTNVNCHFEKETPVWGSAGLTLETGCGTCHDTPPADGNHPTASGPGKKHGDYYGAGSGSCGICHVSHFADANPFSHATSVGRNLILSFNGAPNSGGDYGKPQNLSYPNYLPSRTRPKTETAAVPTSTATATAGGSSQNYTDMGGHIRLTLQFLPRQRRRYHEPQRQAWKAYREFRLCL